MDLDNLKKELNEYFIYVKTIFLNEYSKYLNEETINYVKNLKDVIELNPELSFKIICEDKIIFNLNINKYIEENNLLDKNSYSDINDSGKSYMAYLIKNRNNIEVIIKNKLLKQILKLFIRNHDNVVSIGTIDFIENEFSIKYKLPSEKFIKSKEKEIAEYIKSIVGEKVLLSDVLNGNQEKIEEVYNLYIEENNLKSYSDIIDEFNKIYLNYVKKIGKVYCTDSLYEYQQIDYQLNEKTMDISEEKNNNNITKVKRINSIQQSLVDIYSHKFLFDSMELLYIKNSIVELNKIIEKLNNSLENMDEQYRKAIQIENDSMKYSYRVWNDALTSLDDYYTRNEFNFLIGTDSDSKIVEATLISSNHLKKIKTLKYSYGFIYEINKDSIIYASTNNFISKEVKDGRINYNTIIQGDIKLEIDDQSISKLITPFVIVNDNVQNSNIENKVILDRKNIRRIAVYCFLEDDLANSSNYVKASELAENFELPVVKIDKNNYYQGSEEEIKKIDIKIVDSKEKKESLFDKIKKTKDKILYEESINDFKKTL